LSQCGKDQSVIAAGRRLVYPPRSKENIGEPNSHREPAVEQATYTHARMRANRYRYGGAFMAGEVRNSTALSLVSIYEISKILTSSLDLHNTLRDVLNLMASYLQMSRGVVALSHGNGEFEVIAAANMSQSAAQRGAASLPRPAAERIVRSAMPFVALNAAEDPMVSEHHLAGRPPCETPEMVSFIGVPIKTMGKPFGVLAIDRVWGVDTKVSFEHDVRFLVMVANLIAQAIRLHDSVAADRTLLMDRSNRLDKLSPRREPESVEEAGIDGMIGHSRAMREVFALVRQVAPTRSTVLLRGESGTGKELVARALHQLSTRKGNAFVKVNCAALPESLLESELFGHERGAFTGATQERKGRFEMADGGTLFLDEIGDISRPFQAKLLRVLQEGEFERVGGNRTLKVNVRLVAATNRNLEEAVAKGEFRGDLYYRINVVPVFMPALRDRREDIPALAQHFLDRFNEENGRRVRLSQRAVQVLQNCNFPGNVRELENCVHRVATMTRTELVDEINLPCQTDTCLSTVLWQQCRRDAAADAVAPVTPPVPIAQPVAAGAGIGTGAGAGLGNGAATAVAPQPVDRAEPSDITRLPQRDRLIQAMEKTGWVQAKAARMLGLTPRQLGYALRKYNIEIKRL